MYSLSLCTCTIKHMTLLRTITDWLGEELIPECYSDTRSDHMALIYCCLTIESFLNYYCSICFMYMLLKYKIRYNVQPCLFGFNPVALRTVKTL